MNTSRILAVFFLLTLIDFLCFVPYSYSKSAPKGELRGYVLLPNKIDIAAVANEAKVYIYLRDYTPRDGKQPLPWEAPIRRVVDFKIRSLTRHKVAFQFSDLPEGTYGVSVLVDTGRPHVLPGSQNFTAFPGDYTGGMKDNVKLENGQTLEVTIEEGLYVTIPDGYEAPLYSPE